jgi:adenylate cyclase
VKRRKIGKPLAALVLGGGIALASGLAFGGGLFDYLEYKTYDLRVQRLSGLYRPSEEIMVALLDQGSIDWARRERGWSWPWPRAAYGEFLDYMNVAGAKAVVFDVIFSEPSVYGEEDDGLFQRAARDYGRAVQTVYFSGQAGAVREWPPSVKSPLFALRDFGGLLPHYGLGEGSGGPAGALFPIAPLLDSAGALGSITGRPDSDSVFRRGDLFTWFDGKAAPSLSAAALLAAGGEKELRYRPREGLIEWGGLRIPADRKGRNLLRFRGSLDRYFPYSAGELLQSAEAFRRGEEPFLPPEDFSGKYVFFGFFAPGLFDICATPISSEYPGVGMHITMLDNLLSGDFLRESPPWLNLILILLPVGLITALALFSGRIALAVGGSLLVLGASAGSGFWAYHFWGLWTPLAAPLAGGLLAFLAASLYNYATEGSQKRFIKSAFSQYLSPTVINQLLARPELLNLGGERREISIFFSDVQGFTTISEGFSEDPRKLTELLNEYLSFMTDTILDTGGTIDKYEGDAIIAFWNAPLDYPDHAARALRASLECQRKLAERQNAFEERFGCRLITRIGLNTGWAVVGNMGSTKRFDYSMLGDAVNLAARLEGLNKQFGTLLICAEATFTQAARAMPVFGRKLAQVAVVGKKEPVTVYEPLGEVQFRGREALFRRFDRARDLFYGGDFAGALSIFEPLSPEDRPSLFYAEQCRYYRDQPGEWKGYWEARSK